MRRCKGYCTNKRKNKDVYLQQHTTWQGLPLGVRKKLIDDTKKCIKRMLRDSRFIQDHESHAALEDTEATAYIDQEVLGDEESEVEDDNSDLKAGDVAEPLEEGWDEDE